MTAAVKHMARNKPGTAGGVPAQARDGQAALAVLFSRGHLAAAVGIVRSRGQPGQLVAAAAAGLAAR